MSRGDQRDSVYCIGLALDQSKFLHAICYVLCRFPDVKLHTVSSYTFGGISNWYFSNERTKSSSFASLNFENQIILLSREKMFSGYMHEHLGVFSLHNVIFLPTQWSSTDSSRNRKDEIKYRGNLIRDKQILIFHTQRAVYGFEKRETPFVCLWKLKLAPFGFQHILSSIYRFTWIPPSIQYLVYGECCMTRPINGCYMLNSHCTVKSSGPYILLLYVPWLKEASLPWLWENWLFPKQL